MIDVRQNALDMLADGISLAMVAAYSGTTEQQIKEWVDEDYERSNNKTILGMIRRMRRARRSLKSFDVRPIRLETS